MASVFTVSQVAGYIRRLFDADYLLNRIQVKGEVSNCKYHSSGHLYFTLKDATAGLSCVMFAGSRRTTDVRLENGMQITAGGSIRAYARDGRYELVVTSLEKEGVGELYQIFARRKQEFEEMGMFAPEYKKPIPRFVSTVGVVTAPSGAAIHDIINITHRRNPSVQLILVPALVQGPGAAHSIASAVRLCDSLHTDVMIVGRGGGSMEDLWAFNEEETAMAVFECATPVISAVGHETDFTITDFVADLRAPTPSAAAELAVFDLQAFDQSLQQRQERLISLMRSSCALARSRTEKAALSLKLADPGVKIRRQRELLENLQERLDRAASGRIEWYRNRTAEDGKRLTASMQAVPDRLRRRLEIASGKLSGVSPLARMASGYAFVTDTAGSPVRSVTEIPEDRALRLYWKDGQADVTVQKIVPNPQILPGMPGKAGDTARKDGPAGTQENPSDAGGDAVR